MWDLGIGNNWIRATRPGAIMDYPDETFLPQCQEVAWRPRSCPTSCPASVAGRPARPRPTPTCWPASSPPATNRRSRHIVRRHGPMVFGVCRRVTGNHHLAEDAFQAVFVVLAAKAETVRPRAALSAWLYGVAYRTALRARTVSDRRRRREAPVETLPEVAHQPSDPGEVWDVAAVLDEEIARLPEHLRVSVVLCELEGQSRQEAARQLDIPEGTLSSRLASARRALAGRLRRRGVVLSASGLSAAFAATATGAPPAALAAKAAAALTPELIPPAVGILTQGVLRIMYLDKLKTAVLIAAAVGLVSCAALAAAPSGPGSNPPSTPNPVPLVLDAIKEPIPVTADAKPLRQGPNKILVLRNGYLTLMDPDGKNERKVSTDPDLYHTSGARLSPDGKMLAIPVLDPLPPDDGIPGAKLRTATLHVRGIDEKEPGTNLGVPCMACVWSPDGTEIACSQVTARPESDFGRDQRPHQREDEGEDRAEASGRPRHHRLVAGRQGLRHHEDREEGRPSVRERPPDEPRRD